ncbi:hypothetical protein RchiOBHm_Chr4g0392841 [Rosa chinensis]|uniref:Uncharacterized protein n=1 Tax=Rosa chinensis TaxID=74649 RepID=A0A2P6QQT9_ROSCH|nr:hypothetical protein RchiOBHm_Chr4g0392841 [Rosa chinensis]
MHRRRYESRRYHRHKPLQLLQPEALSEPTGFEPSLLFQVAFSESSTPRFIALRREGGREREREREREKMLPSSLITLCLKIWVIFVPRNPQSKHCNPNNNI